MDIVSMTICLERARCYMADIITNTVPQKQSGKEFHYVLNLLIYIASTYSEC